MSEVIVDVNEIMKKDNLKNSEYILCIFEVCTNKKSYKLYTTDTTRKFWDEVMEHEIFKKIFDAFKGETLRKYWRCIREANNNKKYIQLVKEHSDIIDNPMFKLLPVINGIANFIKSKKENFEDFFQNLFHKNKKSEKDNSNKTEKIINKKRKETHEEDKKQETKKEIKNETKNEIKNEELDVKNNEEKDDNFELKNCDEMINSLQKFFPDSNKKELFNILYQTSGNVKYAYLYLSDPEKNEKYCFVQTDDYIIQNLRDKSYYQTLVQQKGIDLIREREIFLNIKN